MIFPEAALRACPGYRPTANGEPVARLSVAQAGRQRCLLNIGKGGGDARHAAHPAGDIRRRASFTVGDQTHQEHFTVFGCHLHVGGFHLVGTQQLGADFSGDPGIRRRGS